MGNTLVSSWGRRTATAVPGLPCAWEMHGHMSLIGLENNACTSPCFLLPLALACTPACTSRVVSCTCLHGYARLDAHVRALAVAAYENKRN
jgi:hypothetical protein